MTTDIASTDISRARRDAALDETRCAGFLPFAETWLSVDPEARAFDYGCGAGGWLRLLDGIGMEVEATEPDPLLRRVAEEAGRTIAPDPEAALGACAPGSLALVTALRIRGARDLPDLGALLRPLVPGGILLLSGPNAEHPAHAGSGLDPDRVAADLRSRGAARIAVIRSGGLSLDAPEFGLREALLGVPDTISIAAQMEGDGRTFDRFHPLFAATGDPAPVFYMAHHETRARQSRDELRGDMKREINDLHGEIAGLRAEVEGLKREAVELRRLTRRRGLRRLLHKWRTSRKGDTE